MESQSYFINEVSQYIEKNRSESSTIYDTIAIITKILLIKYDSISDKHHPLSY